VNVSRRAEPMDFIIAGIAALFLFGYLVYALLRPEEF
jgi:K+-transporting ATPase KdpF subunit